MNENVHKLDIWNNWHLEMSLIIKNGNPVADGFISVYANGDTDCGCGGHDYGGHDCGCYDHGHDGHDCDCGCHGHGAAVQNDVLINMLYFAVFRARCGVRISGLGEGFEVSADDLKSLENAIGQLSNIFGYKTGQISLEQFALEIKQQTVYYSTLAGENDNGEPVFFACASGKDDTGYYPVFLTEAHLREFFELYHRAGYVILQNTFGNFLSMLDSNEQLKELGAVIEPLYDCNVSIPPGIRA